jgi:hypothetical protein
MIFNGNIEDTVRAFRANLSSRLGSPQPTPVCPRNGITDDFVQHYSFSADELLAHAGDRVVVHHGLASEELTSRLMFLYAATPVIFSHSSVGNITVTRDQIRRILEGQIRDWSQLGYDHRPIRLFCHAGMVQKSVFKTIATELFSAEAICCDLIGCSDYEELAAIAGADPRSIVFGLRSGFATSELLPISVSDLNRSLPVWLSLPPACPGTQLASWLNIVRQRMDADMFALAKAPGGTISRQAA